MFGVYVARKRIDAFDYQSFVLEGDGCAINMTRRVPVGEDFSAKRAYSDAYLWAATVIRSLFRYKTVKSNKVVFYVDNDTFASWLGYFSCDGGCIKPPKKYFDTLSEIYSRMESVPEGYAISSVQFNRAKRFATDTAWQRQQAESKPEKASDVFSAWE